MCHKNLVPVIWRTAVSEGDVEECQRLLEEQAGGNDQTPMKKKRKLSEGTSGNQGFVWLKMLKLYLICWPILYGS